jgi:hypothetical protein
VLGTRYSGANNPDTNSHRIAKLVPKSPTVENLDGYEPPFGDST